MTSERLHWSRTGLELRDLGLAASAALFEPDGALPSPAERLAGPDGRVRVRFPLPGTPDVRGALTGKPLGLGTGWLRLDLFDGRWTELLRARLSAPRSASLAEREWNLLCRLRAAGIGTCEPVLVGARGSGLVSRRSFLLVRELEGAFPLPRWLRTDGLGAERERGLRALAAALAGLERAGVALPELRAEHLWLSPSGAHECEGGGASSGPRKNRLPGVFVSEVAGGSLSTRAAATRRLAPLRESLAEMLSPEELERLLEPGSHRTSVTPAASSIS